MFIRIRLVSFAAFWLALAVSAPAQDYQIETVADGLDHPWSIDWLPDGRALVTERTGRLQVFGAGWEESTTVRGVPPVHAASQGGLFEARVGPDYRESGWIYLSYAHGAPDANATRLARARLRGDVLIDLEVLFTAQPLKDTPVHYGGRMAFLTDDTLLLGLGDGFDYREEAQKLDSHLGTIVRLGLDGAVPDDNPFVERDDALPEIYSYGHRNIQGLVVDAATGTVWQHEHGPRGGDEVNIIRPGENYGWPLATGGIDYSGALVSPWKTRPGMVDPLHGWTPSIAPAGLAIYDGEAFAEWHGDLLVAALVSGDLRRLEIRAGEIVNEESLFGEIGDRLRAVRVGPDGAIYVLTDARDGRVVRIAPSGRP